MGDLGSIPGSGRSPGERNGKPLQYSCLKNPMDGRAWWATVHGVAKSWTRLSDLTLTSRNTHNKISKLYRTKVQHMENVSTIHSREVHLRPDERNQRNSRDYLRQNQRSTGPEHTLIKSATMDLPSPPHSTALNEFFSTSPKTVSEIWLSTSAQRPNFWHQEGRKLIAWVEDIAIFLGEQISKQ